MVKFIKKRIYNQDQSYKYLYYKIVDNKKKRISSKKYHEYVKKKKNKKRNTLPILIIKNATHLQFGGGDDKKYKDAQDFNELRQDLRKYENNENIKFGKAFIVDHGISKSETDKGKVEYNEEQERKLKELLNHTDFKFNTRYMYIKETKNGKKKKMAVLIGKNSDKLSKYLSSNFKGEFSAVNFDNEVPDIKDDFIDMYITLQDDKTGKAENLLLQINKAMELNNNLYIEFTEYLSFLKKLSAGLEEKIRVKLHGLSDLKQKKVKFFRNQVIFALIANSMIGQDFLNRPNNIDYNVNAFKKNLELFDTKGEWKITYDKLGKLVRERLDSDYQFDKNHHIPLSKDDLDTVNKNNWTTYYNKYVIYRDLINKTLEGKDDQVSCNIVKVFDYYFKKIEEMQLGFKDGGNESIKLVNSQTCAYQNGEEVLEISDYYDIMKGFRKGDLFDISSIIKVIKDVLLFDIGYQELESVIEVNKKFVEQISVRLDILEKQQSTIDQERKSLNEGEKTYRDFILNKENPILARIEKMKSYRKWLIEFRDKFLKGESNVQGNFDKCNLNISEITKLIGTENTFGNIISKIDVKSLSLVKELSNIGGKFKNSMNISENIKNDKITYFEFFHSNFSKLEYSSDSTCDNSTDYDLNKKLQCISENEDKFYLQKSIKDFTKLELEYKEIKGSVKDVVIGYPGMYDMYLSYKRVHPFFYNEVETAIKNYKDELIKKKQEGEIKRAELEKTKQEVDKKKKEQDAKVVEIQKAIKEENAEKREILVAKQEMVKARKEEEQVQEIANLVKEKRDKRKSAEDKIKQLEEEAVIKSDRQKVIQENQAQVQAEAEVAVAEAEVQPVEKIPTEVATIEQEGGSEPYITFDKNELKDDDLKDEGYWLRYEMNSKVFLDREKYGDMKYIYLLNQNCDGFGENSILWSSIKSQPVDVTFTNEINTSIKSKDIMGKYITSIMDDKMPNLSILSACCQYRLRNTHSRADAMLLDKIRKDQWSKQTFFGSSTEYDIMDSKDMWTIQKNVNRKISDEKGNTSNDPHWMDLGVAKKKYPESISSLDDMLLDNNSFRRKAAFTSLIKYATYGN